MFRTAVINLDYGNASKDDVKKVLGTPLANHSHLEQARDKVYLRLRDQSLSVISMKEAQKSLSDDDRAEEIYRLKQDEYSRLTTPGNRSNILLTPSINDILSERLSYSIATDVVLLCALFITMWMLPVASLVFAPFVFFTSTMALSFLRFKMSFGRWPNKAELSSIFKYSVDTTISLLIPAGIYLAITGASIFTPVIIHTISIGTVTFGGPIVTYLLAPLIISTIIASGVTLYKDAKLIFNHFFDIQLGFSRSIPFLFSINLRQNRSSLASLFKSLAKTTMTEFSIYFATALATVYLAYVPAGMIAATLFGTSSASAATLVSSLIDIAGHATIGILSAVAITYISEKSMLLLSNIFQFGKDTVQKIVKTDASSSQEQSEPTIKSSYAIMKQLSEVSSPQPLPNSPKGKDHSTKSDTANHSSGKTVDDGHTTQPTSQSKHHFNGK